MVDWHDNLHGILVMCFPNITSRYGCPESLERNGVLMGRKYRILSTYLWIVIKVKNINA